MTWLEPDELPPLPMTWPPGPIPRVFHQIWVGSEVPGWVRRAWRRWDAQLGDRWTVMRWLDHDPELDWLLGAGIDLAPRGLADLIRCWAVSTYGGIYADSDTVPLAGIEHLTGERRGWVGAQPEYRTKKRLNNAFFGMPSGYPFLAEIWDHALGAIKKHLTNEHFVAGPAAWYKVWRSIERDDLEVTYNLPCTALYSAAMKRGQEPNLEHLRQEFPGVPVVHVNVWRARFVPDPDA